MAAKNRRTKKKDWDENTDDTSDSDSSGISKRLENISYVKRENQKELKKTKKVLTRLCDSDDDSDTEQKKLRSSRPMTSLPIATAKKFSKEVTSTSDSSSSDENQPHTSRSKILKEKLNSRKKEMVSSETDMEHRKQVKRRKVDNQESKPVIKTKSKNKNKISKNNPNKSKNFNSDTDSSSGKEFQKPHSEKKRKSRPEHSFCKNVVEENSFTDYSHLATPNKSDEENIQVTKKSERALKNFVVEEIEKIQRLADNLKEDLESHNVYVLNKNITVLREAKFFAHKLLRIYDSVYSQIKESGKLFSKTYESWINSCTNNKSPVHKPVKTKYFLDSTDEENNQAKPATPSPLSKKNRDNSAESAEKEKSLVQKKKNKQENKNSKKFSKKEEKSDDETDEKSDDEEKHSNTSKLSLKRHNTSSSKSHSKSISENDDVNVGGSDMSLKLHTAESDAYDKPDKKAKTKNSERQPENDSGDEVSACDSDEIFSGDEARSEKSRKSKSVAKLKKSNEETNETDERDKNEAEDSTRPTSPPDCLILNESEELFDSTASEIPNTPVKSPVLGKSIRKTMFLASKAAKNQTFHETEKINDDEDDKAKPESPVKFDLPEFQAIDFVLESTSTEKSIETAPTENPKDIHKNDDDDSDNDDNDDNDKDKNNDDNDKDKNNDDNDKDKNNDDNDKDNNNDGNDKDNNNDDNDKDKNNDDNDKDKNANDVDVAVLTDVEDTERRALEDLLQDVDSDQSTYCLERRSSPIISDDNNDDEYLDDISSRSSSSRLVSKRQKQPGTLPLAAKPSSTSCSMSSKKSNPIFADSSSSDSEDGGDATRAVRQLQEKGGSRSSRRVQKALLKNRHYLADAKLRARCRVALERLPRSLLVRHARALDKSKRYVTNKKLLSIMNLDGLESRKKSKKMTATESSDGDDSSTANKTGKAKKKSREEKKSVKDHLGEINEVDDNSDVEAEDQEEDNGKQKSLPTDVNMEINAIDEAENKAKEALLKSDSTSNDEDEDERDVDKKDDKGKKKTKSSKNKSNDSENKSDKKSDDENSLSDESKTKKKEKSAWKSDKILTYQVTDSESEEERASKSVEKKRAKDKEKKDSANEEANGEKTPEKKSVKKKRKQRKRVLDSDSDAKIDSNAEESDPSVVPTESEEEQEETKKKRGKKRRQKSSESESSSGEKKSKSKRKRIKKVTSDSDSDNEQDSPGKGRKNIRKVLKDKHVADDTKRAAIDEEERLKRIAERQKLFNEMYDARLAGEAKVDKLVLDVDEESKEELVVVDEELVKRLKPHQAKGIKFMWDACFESLKQMEESDGSGCIIAHCMGLGKTFQVVTLAHTLLTHEETKINTVMVVCPLSTVLNWVNEFKTWLKYTKNSDDIEIYELTKMKKNIERKYMLESWQKTGGVLIIGYEMFRNLTSTGKRMRKAMQESVMRSLVDPGADLVVCDEGHLLKNEESALSKAMKLVKTRRRVVLTGTPLQNNLKEYHCMVQFVKPNLLGTKKEFLNRFVNPITNGQFDDSTPYDVKLMKKRAHVLHKMLEGSVQRFDYSVLTPFLPPKQEYVIFVRLTEVQIKMYRHYLDNFARQFGVRNGSLFADFQELQRIWTHPYVLRLNAQKVEKANEKKRLEASDSEGSLKDFIDDESDTEVSSISSSHSGSNSDVQCIDSDNEKIPKTTRSTRLNPKDEPVNEVPAQVPVEEEAWWKKFVEDEHFEDLRVSTKLTLLFGILKESEQIGDKVLVFSQSLYSLTLIEHFLNLIDQETQNGVEAENLENHSGAWGLGLDYFRLDGSTSAENRSAWCKIFNNPKNTRARLFLISTRAGGLGINLTAANRVIIFDASWNPSHDVQSIFRIYRFGQKKPCYVYRFLAAGTMEEKIYNRQVTKLSLACRVVDEQQIERHYSNNDLAELYQFESYEGQSITLNLPKDRLLAEIFLKYKDAVYNYHEHDSLLENKQEEELDEEERKQAWAEYEDEKQGKRQMMNVGNNMAFNQMLMNMASFPELENIKLLLQKDYPNLPPEHLDSVARQAVFDMYRYVDQQAMNPMLNPYGAAQVQQQNLLGAPAMQQIQQQQQLNQQSQLLNMLNQPQMNYAGVNHMPAYSGRGRPPKHMSVNNLVNNPMANMRQMQTPMQLQQAQMQAMRNNDEIEVLADRGGPQSSNITAPNMNNKPEE